MRDAHRPTRTAIALLVVAALAALTIVAVRTREAASGSALSTELRSGQASDGNDGGSSPLGAAAQLTRAPATDEVPDEQAIPVEASEGTVQVRSADGLPLRHVEWRREPGGWVLCDDARVPGTARRVRALGHVETEVAAGASEVALPADALLEVVVRGLAPDELSAALRKVEVTMWPPYDEDAAERAVLFADTGRGSLALASVPLRTSPERWSFEVHAVATFSSGVRLDVYWPPASGERTSLVIDLEPQDVVSSSAPLELRELGAPEAPDALRRITLVRSSGAASTGRSWRAGNAVARVHENAPVWRAETRGPAVVPDLPTQADFKLAFWRSDGWYAATTLRHDGTPRDIELSPPARLLAHVVDDEGRAVADATARISFDDVDGLSADARFWNCAPTTSDGAGRVELTAPTGVLPIDPARRGDLPRACRVSFEAAFHDPVSLEAPLDPGVVHDLGRVVLPARKPDIVVQFPDFVPALHQATWEADGDVRSPAIARVRPRGEHMLDIELEAGAAPPTAERIVLFTQDGAVSARRVGEHYAAEETRRLRCAVDMSALDPPPRFVHVGARIGPLTWQVAGSFREDVLSAEHTIDVVVPESGVELFWREKGDAPQYGPSHPLPWPSPGEVLRLVR